MSEYVRVLNAKDIVATFAKVLAWDLEKHCDFLCQRWTLVGGGGGLASLYWDMV